jgi:hypothetical protein
MLEQLKSLVNEILKKKSADSLERELKIEDMVDTTEKNNIWHFLRYISGWVGGNRIFWLRCLVLKLQ